MNLNGVLKSGGVFVFSASHPASEFFIYHPEGNYFDIEQVQMQWSGFGEPRPVITLFRRSFGAVINPILEAGLLMDTVLEPKPTEQFKHDDPEEYERLMRNPAFICVRAKKAWDSDDAI